MWFWSWISVAPLSNSRILQRSLLLGAALLFAVSPVRADGDHEIVRIEEDWVLVVGDPDATTNGPQVMTVFSPTGHVDDEHCQFLINHRTLPDFVAGGLQIQVWDGEQSIGSRNFPNQDLLDSEGEVVTWTQSMRLNDCSLQFEIENGNSTAWGTFGGQGYLRDSISTSCATLAGYDPAVSVKQSGVTFAANRVSLLVLKEVRWYSEEGLETRDTTARVVHQQ